MTINTGNNIQVFDKKNFQLQSQQLIKTYIDAGSFAIFSNNFIEKNDTSFFPNNFYGYKLKKNNAIDIDDEDDWLLAEALYYLKYKKKKNE